MIIAGPCAVESRSQMLETAQAVKKPGAHVLRGGAYKPRTSPYSFQGLGEEGLEILAEARELTGLPVVTEVMSPEQVAAGGALCRHAPDRRAQHAELRPAAGGRREPDTRCCSSAAISATIEELLMAAEYILSHGNRRVDPVRARHPHLRNRHPQHHRHQRHPGAQIAHPPAGHPRPQPLAPGTGNSSRRSPGRRSPPGADGLIVEVHPNPGGSPLRRRAVAQTRALRRDGPAGAGDCRDVGRC